MPHFLVRLSGHAMEKVIDIPKAKSLSEGARTVMSSDYENAPFRAKFLHHNVCTSLGINIFLANDTLKTFYGVVPDFGVHTDAIQYVGKPCDGGLTLTVKSAEHSLGLTDVTY